MRFRDSFQVQYLADISMSEVSEGKQNKTYYLALSVRVQPEKAYNKRHIARNCIIQSWGVTKGIFKLWGKLKGQAGISEHELKLLSRGRISSSRRLSSDIKNLQLIEPGSFRLYRILSLP